MMGFFYVLSKLCYNRHMTIKLSEETRRALDVMGYHELLTIQEKVIPYLLDDKDVVVKAKTGSGKTASFVIPLCEKIDWQINEPQVIVLACTRELAMQIQNEFSSIGKFKKIKATTIIGKENMVYQKDALKQKCHVVVATPGRLYDHIQQGNIDLSQITHVIIDEADYMLDMGFSEQVEQILDELPKTRVTALFSATYPQQVQKLINTYTNDAVFIDNIEDTTIVHQYIQCERKWHTLLKLLNEFKVESGIIFCNQQVDVDKIFKAFNDNGIHVLKIHGGMLQKDRISSIEAFKKGKSRLLVATDVVARGIDIEKVSHVFHYDIPNSIKDYTHRCGRSGRVGLPGCSIMIINDEMEMLDKLKEQFELNEIQVKDTKQMKLSYLNERVVKQDKVKKWKNDVCKLYFSVGKSKKVRAIDMVGSLCSIDGVSQDDIGVINILNNMSYVEILNGKEKLILEAYKNKKIKNKNVKVEIANE